MTTEAKPCDLLVTADLVMTLDAAGRIVKNGAIAVTDRTIVDIGPADELRTRWTPAETIEGQGPGRGRIAMAGLVNVHNHTPLMITRGMIEDVGFAPMYTPGVPQGHWLDADDAYALSALGHYELLRAGCTTVMDFYRYPSSCARAASELGVRAVIAGRVHDAEPGSLANGTHSYSTAIGQASLKENAELIAQWNGHDNGRIRCDWAPHAPDTCSDDLLREVKKLADAHGGNVHTHLSQLPAEIEAVKARTGLTPPQLMDKLGLLNEKLIAAHCIHMDRADIELCGRSKMTVAHAPIGNAKGGRIAPIMELMEAGARIALCTDTFSGDMIEAMRWAISMQRINRQGNVLDPRTVLDWGTQAGANALGLGHQVGSLEIGKKADVDPARQPLAIAGADDRRLRRAGAQRLGPRRRYGDRRWARRAGRAAGSPLADGDAIVANAQAVAARLWQRAGREAIG